jgi:predicted RNA methylase
VSKHSWAIGERGKPQRQVTNNNNNDERSGNLRPEARLKLGYYPLPAEEAHRIARWLQFSSSGTSVLDPCAGTGAALAMITHGTDIMRYAIELDAYRAEDARANADEVFQGSAFDCHAPVESFSLLYLNPPYDFEVGAGKNERMESIFLEHFFRWLKPGGVLVMVIPFDRAYECRRVLTPHFRDKAIYRLTAPESILYKQIVLFGIRRTRQEKDRLTDQAAQQANYKLRDLTRTYKSIPDLEDTPERIFAVPPSSPARLEHKGLPVDRIEDLVATSSASLQAQRVTHARNVDFTGRPLISLHQGHVGLLCTSGLLNGKFGTGDERHLAYWDAVKVSDRTEEEDDDGATVIREKERFSQRLTLLYGNGRFSLLSETVKGKENANGERTSAAGAADVHAADEGSCDERQPASGTARCGTAD